MSTTLMQPLPSQEFLESLIIRPSSTQAPLPPKVNHLVIIYFTARWCGACKRLDLAALQGVRNDAIWFKCDVDENTYSPGYCGVRSIPAFQAIVDGKAQPLFNSSSTAEVAKWLLSFP